MHKDKNVNLIVQRDWVDETGFPWVSIRRSCSAWSVFPAAARFVASRGLSILEIEVEAWQQDEPVQPDEQVSRFGLIRWRKFFLFSKRFLPSNSFLCLQLYFARRHGVRRKIRHQHFRRHFHQQLRRPFRDLTLSRSPPQALAMLSAKLRVLVRVSTEDDSRFSGQRRGTIFCPDLRQKTLRSTPSRTDSCRCLGSSPSSCSRSCSTACWKTINDKLIYHHFKLTKLKKAVCNKHYTKKSHSFYLRNMYFQLSLHCILKFFSFEK